MLGDPWGHLNVNDMSGLRTGWRPFLAALSVPQGHRGQLLDITMESIQEETYYGVSSESMTVAFPEPRPWVGPLSRLSWRMAQKTGWYALERLQRRVQPLTTPSGTRPQHFAGE